MIDAIRKLVRKLGPATFGLIALGATCLPALAQTKLTLWSHWADQEAKVAFVEKAARQLEAKNPGTKIEITWFQKPALYAALKTALRAGQGPDVFYAETDQTEYVDNDFLLDLTTQLNWANIEPWAKEAWTYKGKAWGFPLEVWSVELYYNKDLMKQIGVTLPEDGQVSQGQFLDIVKKAAAANLTPIAQGVGDRPFPGAFLVHEPLLKKLGKDDYSKLLAGELSWKDPRVVEVLRWVKQVVDAGALPKDYTSVKHGEAHYYFHTKPQAVMFPMGSFYPSRAFNPPDKGGEPQGFQLGIMKFPAMDGGTCAECKTLAIGGSFVVNAGTKYPKLAVGLLNEMATEEMGNRWLETGYVGTGVKTDPSKITGERAWYFREMARINAAADYAIGLPNQRLAPKPREVFAQVMNVAFPAGLLNVDESIAKMEQSYK